MRKSKQEAAQTRERIVLTAAAEFRRSGIGATGIADLMSAAGLTNGGFYRHFESKNQLLTEASTAALSQVIRLMTTAAENKTGPEGLEAILQTYLATSHRDAPETGCLFGALGSELVHADEQTREVATDGFSEMVEIVAAQLTGLEPADAKTQALVALSTMIGALLMSRVVTDETLSEAILSAATDSIKDAAAT